MVLLSHRFLRCFVAKKCTSHRAALYKNMQSSPFRIVVFGVFLCASHFASVCYGGFADSRLFAHASLDLHLSFSSVRGWGGGWGAVMTSMRMRLVSSVSFVASYVCRILHRFLHDVHANAACVFCFFCCALLLKRCRLLCEALVAASCCFTFETSTMQKPRVFEAFQTKTSQLTLKINKKQRRKAWYLRQFRKHLTKKQDKKLWKKTKPETSSSLRKPHKTQDFQAFEQKHPNNTARRQTHVPPCCCCCQWGPSM